MQIIGSCSVRTVPQIKLGGNINCFGFETSFCKKLSQSNKKFHSSINVDAIALETWVKFRSLWNEHLVEHKYVFK